MEEEKKNLEKEEIEEKKGKRKMKAWKKWAIVGVVWGLISAFASLIVGLGAMPHSPTGLSKVEAFFYLIVFLPGLLSTFIVFPLLEKTTLLNLYSWNLIVIFLFLAVPISIGILLSLLIYKVSQAVWRRRL